MDYEKKYNEALERAKTLYENANGMILKKWVEQVFPELKESEDEKIRKGLIDFVNQYGDKFYGQISKEYAIAWLERQGTPAKLSEEEQNRFAKGVLSSCALSFIDYLDAHKYEGKMCVSNGECEDIENAFHNAMWDRLHRYYCKYIEKQGKKNPHEDIVDEINRKAFPNHYGGCAVLDNEIPFGAKDSELEEVFYSIPNGFHAEIEDDKVVIKKGEQKSWSKEDEDNFKHLMDEIVCLGNSRNSANRLHYDRLIKFLYELKNRAQPREEWRDKDERMLDRLIAYFEKQVAFTDDDNPRYAKWLKSLRPQNRWKPSDEQMKAIRHICDGNYNVDLDILDSIYRDFKKLREE